MDRLFYLLLTLALQWFRPRFNVHLQLLQAQIRILRSRIDVSRIVPTPQEKTEPFRPGTSIGHHVTTVIRVLQLKECRRRPRRPRYSVFVADADTFL